MAEIVCSQYLLKNKLFHIYNGIDKISDIEFNDLVIRR